MKYTRTTVQQVFQLISLSLLLLYIFASSDPLVVSLYATPGGIPLFLVVCLVWTGYAVFYQRRRVRLFIRKSLPLFLFTGWCLLSAVWSVNPSATVSRTMLLLCTYIAAVYASAVFSLKRLFQLLFAFSALAALVVLFVEFFSGSGAGFNLHECLHNQRMMCLSAGYSHPNLLASFMLLGCLCGFPSVFSKGSVKRLPAVLAAALLILAIVLAYSLTILALILTGIILWFVLIRQRRLRAQSYARPKIRLIAIAFFLILFSLSIVSCGRSLPPGSNLKGALHKSESFMGPELNELAERKFGSLMDRFRIWNEVSARLGSYMPLGAGFGAPWEHWSGNFHLEMKRLFNPCPNHSHNMFLDLLLETGVVGLFLFAMLLALAFQSVGHKFNISLAGPGFRPSTYVYAASFIFLIIFFLHENMETIAVRNGLNWLFLVFVIFLKSSRRGLPDSRVD